MKNEQPSSLAFALQYELIRKHGVTALASAALMAVSSALILLNKHILLHGFPFPMALAGIGTGFSGIASYLACHVFQLVEIKPRGDVDTRFFLLRLMPVGFFTAITLYFGNLAYLYLTVSFIQMLKSLAPVVTMAVLFVAGIETPTRRLILAVCCIALGTGMASAGELNFDLIGLCIVLMAEVVEAVRLVMTQVLLKNLQFHPIEGLMYLGPACAGWLVTGSVLLEVKSMALHGAWQVVLARPLQFAAAAMLGFCVNGLGYIVIHSSSSLTLKVVGSARNAVVVWIGFTFLHEDISITQAVGYAASLIAFFWYTTIKMQAGASIKIIGVANGVLESKS